MPCLWLSWADNKLILDCAIIDIARYNDWLSSGDILDHPPHRIYKALLDTGSNASLISNSVVAELGLVSYSATDLQGIIGEPMAHKSYDICIGLLPAAPDDFHGMSSLTILPAPVVATNVAIPAELGFDVVLGMDIIGQGSLAVEGNGTFSFSF